MLSAQMIARYAYRIGYVSDIGVLTRPLSYCHNTLIVSDTRFVCPSKLAYVATILHTRCRHTFETRDMCLISWPGLQCMYTLQASLLGAFMSDVPVMEGIENFAPG